MPDWLLVTLIVAALFTFYAWLIGTFWWEDRKYWKGWRERTQSRFRAVRTHEDWLNAVQQQKYDKP